MIDSDVQEEQEKRDEFKNILLALAKSEDLLEDSAKRYGMYKRLEALYYSPNPNKGFRHFYSDIFQTLTEIKKQPEHLGSIEILGQNLAYLRKHYQTINKDSNDNPIDISKSLQKLLDHVSLDIARIEYSDAGDWKISQEDHISRLAEQVASLQAENDVAKERVEALQTKSNEAIARVEQLQTDNNQAIKKVEELQSANTKAQKLQQQLKSKIENQQKEYIAILGIFAAVVLTFNAAIAYSSSIFQNIDSASIYRLIAISLLIGLVTIAILAVLFYFIDRIVNFSTNKKPIFATVVIIVIGVLLIATIAFWKNGIVEKRNSTVNNTQQTTNSVP